MSTYRIVFGAYVRMYVQHIIEADDHEAALKRAIEEFDLHSAEFQWIDANYDNLALPSICSVQTDDPPGDVLEGYDFSATPSDARQYAADKLLSALSKLMPHIQSEIDQRQHSDIDEEWIELNRKASDARAAIAQATALDGPLNNQETTEPRL
jgi:hypothetical protein